MKKFELIVTSRRFKNISAGAPFFLTKRHKDDRLWFKAKTGCSAFCIADGSIRYVSPYARVKEVVGGL